MQLPRNDAIELSATAIKKNHSVNDPQSALRRGTYALLSFFVFCSFSDALQIIILWRIQIIQKKASILLPKMRIIIHCYNYYMPDIIHYSAQ